LSIIILFSSLIPVIFVGFNQTKLVWECERYPECDSIGSDTLHIPRNPLGLNQYIIKVIAHQPENSLYWIGNITFTHQETAETYFFRYVIGGSSTYFSDTAQEVWIVTSGAYDISWENTGDPLYFHYNYEFSLAGLGYPNDKNIFILTIVIFIFCGHIALYVWGTGFFKYKYRATKPTSKASREEEM
jgi:hypothetical protein